MNPPLLKSIPYALAASIGFGLAWGIQGLRLTSAEQEFIAYKQEQTRILQEHNTYEAKRQKESALAYEAARQELADSIAAGDVLKRCIAAGRCGASPVTRVRQPAGSAGNGISPPSRIDEASADAISSAGKLAAECAVTTLQLNQLQDDIAKQEGY